MISKVIYELSFNKNELIMTHNESKASDKMYLRINATPNVEENVANINNI